MKKKYHVIGLMSGTSLDGLDIAYCTFTEERGKWKYTIKRAKTIPFNEIQRERLLKSHTCSGEELISFHSEFGRYIGVEVKKFTTRSGIKQIDFVASHGHTVFHSPQQGYTFQLGSGADISAACGFPVVSDFRTLDVALNGQGAPLVPAGDKLLFPNYTYCLNLGGFSNISFDNARGERVAFDICPVNIVLNRLAMEKGMPFDKGGVMAKSGKINNDILGELNNIDYYAKPSPKSLSREWLEAYFMPIIDVSGGLTTNDKIATVCEHIVIQITKVLSYEGIPFGKDKRKATILVTGGGANNTFLINKLKKNILNHKLIIPDKNLVKYKEALIFAFLGVLRWENKINTYKSVTGASRDSCGGVIFRA